MRERASVICVHHKKILTVRLEDPYLKLSRLFLPGGKIETNIKERPNQAAVRETLEETGWQVQVAQEADAILEYDFFWNGSHVPCRTHFFWAQLLEETEPKSATDDDPYYQGWEWLDLKYLKRDFDYHPRILQVIENILGRHLAA